MFVLFGMGLLFSVAANKAGRPEGSVLGTRHFRLSFAFAVVIGGGIALACYIIEPDWMWMYWVNYREVPLAVVIYAFCGYPTMFVLGYLVAPELGKLRPNLDMQVYYLVNVIIIVIVLVFIHRIWHVGTIEEYAGGSAQGMVTLSPFSIMTVGWVLLLATPPVGAALVWMYRKIASEAAPPEPEKA
jgi:hypothetical protein